jgi:hypothetical protein
MRLYRVVYVSDASVDFVVKADKMFVDAGVITLILGNRVVLAVSIGASVLIREVGIREGD